MTATTTKGSHVLRAADNSVRVMLGGAPWRERVAMGGAPRERGSRVGDRLSEGT